jgi:hypothetical protein
MLGDIVKKYRVDLYPRFLQLDTILVQLRSTYREQFFVLLNSWHALATGHIIAHPDDLHFLDLSQIFLEGISTAMPGWGVFNFMQHALLPHTEIDCTAATLELSGLAKAYGHPCIITRQGLTTMREFACAVKPVDPLCGEIAQSNFIYHYTKNFFKKNGRWPAHRCSANCHPIIATHSLQGSWPSGEDMRALNPRDWQYIELMKELEYDYTPDVVDLLSDKACAPSRSKWPQTFDTCGFRLFHNVGRPPFGDRDETRVLIRYLQGSEDEVREVIQEVNSFNMNPDDDIVVLCPKEGEEKGEGRLFAKLTYRRRLYQTSTEHNIGLLMKYFPYQTMTISELELLKLIGTMGRTMAKGLPDDAIPFHLRYSEI